MTTAREYLVTDLAESIPEILYEAMNTGQADIIRGLTAMANIMWHTVHPTVRLIEKIALAVSRGEDRLYSGDLREVMNSTRGDEIIGDFVKWNLIDYDEENDAVVIPDFWKEWIMPNDPDNPDMGIESIGRLIGICSLACHADQHTAIGLSSYEPIIDLIREAKKNNGKIHVDTVLAQFTNGDRRANDLIFGKAERVTKLRFFSDTSGKEFILSADVLRVFELIRQRTNQRFLNI